ncbi:FliI/YscN family ATPase [Actibacterium sp. 188UL27-1]|uniref:FliI/YscN family ATPase n=1 Tax=Actibacterium sp. 188UL27-1 TaxID=2786961 RepID=UPI001958AA07|nr:FliI/YscN family ATPase [Actibacterium sp. 188UL27-1]MBM7066203.1 FliI/YscN family ATPase [Actibacterium sp. 188UL27-1]
MEDQSFKDLCNRIADTNVEHQIGRVISAGSTVVRVTGLSRMAAIGDQVAIGGAMGEIIDINTDAVTVLPDRSCDGLRIGEQVTWIGRSELAPDDSWLGHVIDPYGAALDGGSLIQGPVSRSLRAAPPPATQRRHLGPRMATGLAVFDTILPLVRGQRMGLFAGSGVGKSMLLGQLAQNVDADVIVVALVGERGREVREFVDKTLGPERMAKTVVVAATSDQPPIARRRAVWSAMTVAEHFRDAGKQVFFLADSITRFAEAHREIALAAGEGVGLHGFPPSTAHLIMSLAERAGPGQGGTNGDITAIFSVLVAGSDMEGPIADTLRGVLDGHVVLDREIAERGRYPAIDVLRSVSRSLPGAANDHENALIALARRRLGAYDRAEMMIQSGLYSAGSDGDVDAAVQVWPALDAFIAEKAPSGPNAAFDRLADCLRAARPVRNAA